MFEQAFTAEAPLRRPRGMVASVEVGRGSVTVIVRWPVAVSVADGIDTCELRDVSSLAAAMATLGLPARYRSSVLDLLAVLLEDVTFSRVDPVVSDLLWAEAARHDMTPSQRLAFDIAANTEPVDWVLPGWLGDVIADSVMSAQRGLLEEGRQLDVPPQGDPHE